MKKYEYSDGETLFEGYLASSKKKKRPCVLVAHAWDGPNDHFNSYAEGWAQKGFVAFAIDVYGKGKRGKIDGDNSHLMNPLLQDRHLLRKRLLAAFVEACTIPEVDPNQIIIIGHCFGGLCALDLARAVPKGLLGSISIHGPLQSPNFKTQKKIEASILVLHGWEDPVAKTEHLLTFANEMTRAQADWQINAYGHAQHAFTFIGADIPELGIKYNEKAHYRSTAAVSQFVDELIMQT